MTACFAPCVDAVRCSLAISRIILRSKFEFIFGVGTEFEIGVDFFISIDGGGNGCSILKLNVVFLVGEDLGDLFKVLEDFS